MFIEPYLSNITIFAGNFAPRGWMFCQGQLLAISNYDALFSLIGTTYGGDGQTTFGLPDLRGRKAIHIGQGPGLPTNFVQGQIGGTTEITLTTLQLGPHTHTLLTASGTPGAQTGAGTVATPLNNVPAALSATIKAYNTKASGTALLPTSVVAGTPVAGGNQPFQTLQPFMAMNYVICVEGIYPSRN